MEKLTTLIIILFFSLSASSQTVWLFNNASGLGDGTSWEDANNWTDNATGSLHQVPAAGDEARLVLNNTITGVVANNPGNITIGGGKTVTLDLDVSVGLGLSSTQHGLTMFNNSELTIAPGRTLTVNVPDNKEGFRLNSGKTNTIIVSAGATIEIQSSLNGIFIEDATHTITNNGVINITGSTKTGINHIAGTIENNGTITISSTANNDGIEFTSGSLQNNGILNISGSTVDNISTVGSGIVNAGTMNLNAPGIASANNCIEVGVGGYFENTEDGIINGTVASGSGRVISVEGTFENSGEINVSGGNANRSISGDGGSITNNKDAYINLNETRIFLATGSLVNEGLIFSSDNGISQSNGVSTNKGFFNSPNGSFTNEFGLKVPAQIDAEGESFIDFNGDGVTGMTVYDWYFDGTFIGSNNADGILDLTDADFPNTAGPHTITLSATGSSARSSAPDISSLVDVNVSNVSASTVPVELANLQAMANQNNVELSWKTLSEVNNDYFEVERSMDGKLFIALGQVKGQGTTNIETDYEFLDRNPAEGINYYRLKQVDIDGRVDFSKIVKASVESDHETIKLFPTFVSDIVYIKMVNKPDQIIIYNSAGQVVRTITNPAEYVQFSTSNFAPGSYFVSISRNRTVTQERFIKL